MRLEGDPVPGVIDIMNYAPYVAPGLSGTEYRYQEFQTMVRTTLRPLLRDGVVTTQWGRQVKVDAPPAEADPTLYLDEAIKSLDESGCDMMVLRVTDSSARPATTPSGSMTACAGSRPLSGITDSNTYTSTRSPSGSRPTTGAAIPSTRNVSNSAFRSATRPKRCPAWSATR